MICLYHVRPTRPAHSWSAAVALELNRADYEVSRTATLARPEVTSQADHPLDASLLGSDQQQICYIATK
jgi:hypothetical protein